MLAVLRSGARAAPRRGGRIADFGRNAFTTDFVGLDVGTADQVDAVRHRGENSRYVRRQSLQRLP
jgi:hypothetical protein